jgi:hypothetical protein
VKGEIGKYPHPDNIPYHSNRFSRRASIGIRSLMDEIFRCIESEDRISDYASKGNWPISEGVSKNQ